MHNVGFIGYKLSNIVLSCMVWLWRLPSHKIRPEPPMTSQTDGMFPVGCCAGPDGPTGSLLYAGSFALKDYLHLHARTSVHLVHYPSELPDSHAEGHSQ